MKTIKVLPTIVILVLSIFVVSSCLKTNVEENKVSEKLTDLVIPSDFNWSTSRQVTFSLSSPKPVKLSIFYAEEDLKNNLLAECIATNEQNDPLILSLPNNIDQVFVKYQKNDGQENIIPLSISLNKVTFVVPNDAKEVELSTKANSNSEQGVIFYPSEGWGTILFEDLFPDKGDYDFNDFVANYIVEVFLQNKNKVYSAYVALNVNAVGGQLPYQFYLQLDGVSSKEISSLEIGENILNCPNFTCELVSSNDKDAPAVFLFKNVEKNPNKPANSNYINTEKDYILEFSKLVNVNVKINFKNAIKLENISENKFNFFLAKGSATDLDEIHVSGFAPTKYGESKYNDLKKNSSNLSPSDSRYYFSKDNFTWGILVPMSIPHTYESIDFMKAYPNFKDWAVSGGTKNKNWYLSKYRNNQYMVNSL